MAENPVTKLPLVAQVGIAGGVAVLICGAFWYLWYRPNQEEVTKREAQLEELQKDIRAMEVTANKLPEFQREVQILEAKLERLKRILPAERETPDLIRRVQAMAQGASLQIKKFTPAAAVSRDFYQEVPIDIDVEGTYHNLGLFFDRVGRLSRLVSMKDVKVKASSRQTQSNTVAVSSRAMTYIYLEPVAAGPGKPGALPPAAK
jgi:type IV pilus assembly protein PilO